MITQVCQSGIKIMVQDEKFKVFEGWRWWDQACIFHHGHMSELHMLMGAKHNLIFIVKCAQSLRRAPPVHPAPSAATFSLNWLQTLLISAGWSLRIFQTSRCWEWALCGVMTYPSWPPAISLFRSRLFHKQPSDMNLNSRPAAGTSAASACFPPCLSGWLFLGNAKILILYAHQNKCAHS